ncbi:Beta-TrCP (transducin repeats containing)/Slimb proteins [Phaffia rhodozyma]|uniref:Beta-TrCP (Transducin repeats containing)/Slimb proteins n=1 Tax=Phaffia rhodozyma TaxID=264483 RepID=A0A0F7SQR7_PHARH|nr:Beta-TrCP (transducin repeats containing)/Slimb proteins [Phaffia rhodozyma]
MRCNRTGVTVAARGFSRWDVPGSWIRQQHKPRTARPTISNRHRSNSSSKTNKALSTSPIRKFTAFLNARTNSASSSSSSVSSSSSLVFSSPSVQNPSSNLATRPRSNSTIPTTGVRRELTPSNAMSLDSTPSPSSSSPSSSSSSSPFNGSSPLPTTSFSYTPSYNFVNSFFSFTSPTRPSVTRGRSTSFGGRPKTAELTTDDPSSREVPKKSWRSSLVNLSPFSGAYKGKGREIGGNSNSNRNVHDGSVEDEGFWEGTGARRFDILSQLPTEIALYILLFVPAETQVICSRVSKNWALLASDNNLWRDRFQSNPRWKLRPTFLTTIEPPVSVPSSLVAQLSLSPIASRSSVITTATIASTTTVSQPIRPALQSRTSSLFGRPQERSGLATLDWKYLYRKRRWLENRWGRSELGKETVLEGHSDSVYALHFDGSKIVTGSRDRSIKIWSVVTGECIQTISNAHDASVLSLAYDEETGLLVSGGSDCKVNIWDLGGPGVPQREVVRKATIEGHSQGVLDVALSTDYIVSCSKDTKLNVFSRTDYTHLRSLVGHSGPVNAIAIQGNQAVSASGDGKICLWNLDAGECIRVFRGHERGLACVDFKGDFIVSGSNDRTMKIWRASTGEMLKTLVGHEDLVRTLSFDPNSGIIVSGGYDKKIIIWDMHSGQIIRSLEEDHTSLVFDLQFDAGRIASSSHDKRVVITNFGDAETTKLFV